MVHFVALLKGVEEIHGWFKNIVFLDHVFNINTNICKQIFVQPAGHQ